MGVIEGMGSTTAALVGNLFSNTASGPAYRSGAFRPSLYYSTAESPASANSIDRVKEYTKSIAKKTNLIPAYQRLKNLFDDHLEDPHYLTHPSIQAKTTRPLVKRLREFYGKNFDMAPYLAAVKESFGMLPIYAKQVVERGQDGKLRMRLKPAGVVQGSFDQHTNELTINPVLLSDQEIDTIYHSDPAMGAKVRGIKKWLRDYGVELGSVEQVKAHEYGHFFQKATGAIERYQMKARSLAQRIKEQYPKATLAGLTDYISRAYIEGANTELTNRLTGQPENIYRRERHLFRKLVDKWGEVKAYLGLVPSDDLAHALA